MQSKLEQFGRMVFRKLNSTVPNRWKWEIMSFVPLDYVNIVSAENKEEFLTSGSETVDEIVETINQYDEQFSLSESQVLEIGTGPGRLLVFFGEEADGIYGVDISKGNLRKTKKLAREFDIDPTLYQSEKRLPQFDTKFDLIYSTLVFQHMKRRTTIKYIHSSYDQLKTEGMIYFTFANLNNQENIETLLSEGLNKTYSFRMRYFTEKEVRTYLELAGFKDIQIRDEGHQLVALAKRI